MEVTSQLRQPIHNKLVELGLLRVFLKQANHLWKKHPTRQLSELTKNGYHQEKKHLQQLGYILCPGRGTWCFLGVNLYIPVNLPYNVTLLENRQETITLKTIVVCTKTLGVHVNYIYIQMYVHIYIHIFLDGSLPPPENRIIVFCQSMSKRIIKNSSHLFSTLPWISERERERGRDMKRERGIKKNKNMWCPKDSRTQLFALSVLSVFADETPWLKI